MSAGRGTTARRLRAGLGVALLTALSLVALVLVAVLTPVREDRTQGRTWPA